MLLLRVPLLCSIVFDDQEANEVLDDCPIADALAIEDATDAVPVATLFPYIFFVSNSKIYCEPI